jgi:hypothetical protein
MTASGGFPDGPTATMGLMNDRQVIRVERLAKLFDKERGLDTHVRSRLAVTPSGTGSSFVLDLYADLVYIAAFCLIGSVHVVQ